MSNINIVSSASISGTYQFSAQRGDGDKDGERVRKRGEKKGKKREIEMFSFDLGRSLHLLFASLLWLTLIRLGTQIVHLAYFVFLNIASSPV